MTGRRGTISGGKMRRVALLLVAASVLSIGVFAGPAHAAKVTSCKQDKKLNQNIQAAFAPFFTSDATAEKMATIQDGDKIAPIVEEGARVAAAAGQTSAGTTTYPVKVQATCDGKKAATFTYDLALSVPKPVTKPPVSGAGLNFSGDAVLSKGKWLISGATICDLVGANP